MSVGARDYEMDPFVPIQLLQSVSEDWASTENRRLIKSLNIFRSINGLKLGVAHQAVSCIPHFKFKPCDILGVLFSINKLTKYFSQKTEGDTISLLYRVIHKSVKHLKNSQRMHYSTDHDSSYADRETLQVFFFTYFTDAQCVHLWSYGGHLCVSPSRSTRVSAYRGRPEPQ